MNLSKPKQETITNSIKLGIKFEPSDCKLNIPCKSCTMKAVCGINLRKGVVNE